MVFDLLALALPDSCEEFAPEVRRSHQAPLQSEGRFDVFVPFGPLGDRIARKCGLLRRGKNVLVKLQATAEQQSVRWERRFDDQRMDSILVAVPGGIEEICGDVRFYYELTCEEGALRYRQTGFSFKGRRHPSWLSPRVAAHIAPTQDGWQVEVVVKLPILGTICRYVGRMEAV